MSRYLPQALGATGLVVAGPVVAVWALRAWQLVGSTAVAVGIGVILSLAISFAGSAYWANRDSSRDVLFSELMIWGWLRRWRAEHKLTAALQRLAEQTTAGMSREGTPQLAMLTELAEALEAGDPYTRNHSRRVARYASMIAERLGLAAEDVDRIRTAAMLHDVGKVRTPIEVLHKPGRLTDEEYAVIKAHPVDGARLVEALGDDRLTAIVRHHHERLDGRGYPDGLSGDEIPLGARIISVADTFDAITSARSYRPASPHRKALDILIKEAGTQLDADAVRAFRACYTGRRPIALWMTALAFPQRLSASLGNGTAASAASIPKVIMAASTVAVVGGAAASTRPLLIVPAAPQATATAAAAVTSRTATATAPVARAGTPFVPAALGAKLTSTSVRTREQKLARRPGVLSRRFPRSPAAAHRVGPSSPHASPSSVSPRSSSPPSSSAPVAAPSSSVAPVSPVTSSAPVSTVASAPTSAPTTTAPTTTAPTTTAPTTATPTTTTPSQGGSGSGTSTAPTDGSSKDQGKGSGKGQDQSTGTTKTKTKTKSSPTTTPTTTTPGTDPPGNGNGNGNGNPNGNSNANPNGNGNANPNGNGNGNANGNGNGNAAGTGDGDAAPTGNGNGNGNGGNGNGGNGNGNGNGGNGKGNGHATTTTTTTTTTPAVG